MRSVRGGQVGMIFQQARSALNPLMRIGKQICASPGSTVAPEATWRPTPSCRPSALARSASRVGSRVAIHTS